MKWAVARPVHSGRTHDEPDREAEVSERRAKPAHAASGPSRRTRRLLTLLAIMLLVTARLVAASTLPDQTWMRTCAFTDAGDTDDVIRLVWSHSPSALPAVAVVATCEFAQRVELTVVTVHAPIAVPPSCSRAPPAARAV
jgi:hypothetical protein